MATSRIDRSDDTAAVLKIIAAVDSVEDAVTKQWQSVTISDSTSPAANKMSVSAAGNANVAVNLALPTGTNNIGDVDVLTVPAPLSTTGGGTEATALRVTVASDSTGLLSVDDNGANLSVDWAGTAPPIGAGVEATALRVTVATDSTGVVSVDDNGGNLSVDWAGTVPPIGAGTEAAALRVTLATDSTGLVSVDDNAGSLTVDGTVTSNAGTGDFLLVVGHTRNEAFKESAAVGAELDETAPVAATEGNISPLRISANRNLYTTIRDAAANERGVNVSAGNALLVDASATTQPVSGTVTVSSVSTSVTPGTGATNLGKAEDAAHTTADVGVMALATANEANTVRGADNDYVPPAADTEGNLRVIGNRDHDAVDAGEVVKIGGVAVSGSATPTSVAAADRTRWIFNQHGIPYILGGHPNLITREFDFGTAAQTDLNLAAALVAADERIYVTRFEALCDNANTVNVSVRCGFGTASVPTASATGVSGMIGSHPGIAPGSGIICGNGAGIIAVGGAGEEPRLTSSAATTGNLHAIITYFLVDETP